MASTNWTIENIPALNGKVIIVTGGNSGLGFESVKALSAKGGKVIMACRSLTRGEHARHKILEQYPSSDIVVMELDLTHLKSVREFAASFSRQFTRLDILLNNAGIMMVPHRLTKDNFESQFGTNHLGHFALTGLLLDMLKKTHGSRVVNVSSLAHRRTEIDLNNLHYPDGKGYSPMKAYSRSKLSNLLFTYELQRFFEQKGIDCKSLVAHPGVSDTNLFDHAIPAWLAKILRPLASLFIQPAAFGALPQLRASVDPIARGGEYYGPDGKGEWRGYPIIVKSNAASLNETDARKLWEISEKLTNVIYS